MSWLRVANETTKLIQSHRSIRKYTNEPVPQEVLTDILTCAQWAPSSHNVQAYSIIVVQDQDVKKELASLCGSQRWVETCPVFLVFCADFYRLSLTTQMHATDFKVDEVENLIVGSVDTALAAENALLTARSYGLGGVMIGGIRNQPEQVSGILGLPPYTLPILGMCLGYPDDEPWQKPRLPQKVVVHYETYRKENMIEGLEEYEEISSDYYRKRTRGQRVDGWTKQMAEYLSKPRRPGLKRFIVKQGIHLD